VIIKYFLLLFRIFRKEIAAVPGRLIALTFFTFILFLPAITTHHHILRVLTLAALFTIYAASWDFLSGFAGQLSLGHAGFFGLSAYIAAAANLYLGFSPWATIFLAAIGGVLIGLIFALPALRLRGFYLGLVTLGFPIVLLGLIYVFPDYTGGEMGLYGLDGLTCSLVLDYYVVVLIMISSLFVMWKLTDVNSTIVRTGVVLQAIREDEITARSSGINTTMYKLLAFTTSGFFAGISGGLYAHYMKITGPSTLDIFLSFLPILWTIFGGMSTIYGSVVGVYVLYTFVELIAIYEWATEYKYICLALILITVLLFMPDGIGVWVRDKIEVTCPRCKLGNLANRQTCRSCKAPLRV